MDFIFILLFFSLVYVDLQIPTLFNELVIYYSCYLFLCKLS